MMSTAGKIKQGEGIERVGRPSQKRWPLSLAKSVSDRGNSKCKGPEVESHICSRKSKTARRAGGE